MNRLMRGIVAIMVGLWVGVRLDGAEPGTSSEVTDVWVVAKTHFDLGFTDSAENVFTRYRVEMMDKSLKIIEQNRNLPKEQQFVWTLPGWPLAAQILGAKQSQNRKALVEMALMEGSMTVHALPFSMHTESLEGEDIVRGLGFASSVARNYGKPLPISAKMTDVPSHSWIMPSILANAGVKFLHIGDNPASQFPRLPKLFWWEGPDGSRILCAYSLDYGSGRFPSADWPCKNFLAMIMTGDNHGPPTLEEVAKWREEYAAKMPGVKVHFGTLDDFANAVMAESPQLPVVRKDMPDTWIHGLMSQPQMTRVARNIRPLIPAVEILDTQLRLWGIDVPPIGNKLSEAYEGSLLYGEHTWGMNAKFGPRRLYGDDWRRWLGEMEKEPVPADGDYTRLPKTSKRKWMQSYIDHCDYIRRTETIVKELLDERLRILAENIDIPKGEVIVYNPLPWQRSGVVKTAEGDVFADAVPACGYKTVKVQTGKPLVKDKLETHKLETRYFSATFDLERGGISSLVDKNTGHELADKSSPYALGQFLHERFSSKEVDERFFKKYSRISGGWALDDLGKPGMPDSQQEPYKAISISDWKMSVSGDDVATYVTLSTTECKNLASAYSTTFTFPCHESSLEVEWKVDRKVADKHPEGGWLCFPFAVDNPCFTVGRPGGTIDPTSDIAPGANRHLMAVATGVAINNPDKNGVMICPLDSPLVSLEKPGLWWWSLDFVPRKPTVFVNLYNNMWNTNFPLWQDGSWGERVKLWPMSSDVSPSAHLAAKSWEARIPLLSISTGAATTKKMSASRKGLELSRKGILVTAFGMDPDGNSGTLLRLWEQAGISGDLTVTLPGRFTSAQPVNLRGEKLGETVQVKDGKLSFALGKFAPASFILR